MAMPMSARTPREARTNAAAVAAAVHIMPGGEPLAVPPAPRNPLLVRDGVGRAKASCYDLPGESFAYGRPGNHDVEGAREVSMCWMGHMPSKVPAPSAPNFVKQNMKAACTMVTSAKEMADFRREEYAAAQSAQKAISSASGSHRTPRGQSTSSRRAVIPSDVIENYTYGKQVRTSTPINHVMSNRFAATAEEDLYNFYTQFREQAEMSKQHVRKIPLTIASRGHASSAKKVQVQAVECAKEEFKLSKFKNVTPKTTTGRTRPKAECDLDALANDTEQPDCAVTDLDSLSGCSLPREGKDDIDSMSASEV